MSVYGLVLAAGSRMHYDRSDGAGRFGVRRPDAAFRPDHSQAKHRMAHKLTGTVLADGLESGAGAPHSKAERGHYRKQIVSLMD